MATDAHCTSIGVRWWFAPALDLLTAWMLTLMGIGFPPDRCIAAFENIVMRLVARSLFVRVR